MIGLVAFLYRRILMPLTVFIFRLGAPLWSPKLRRLIEDRDGLAPLKRHSGKPILIHAASGEIEYAKPLIRYLKKEYPEIPIVVSYFSPSALRMMEGLGADEVLPLPFDLTSPMEEFLDRTHPQLVMLARTDVWPEMARQCRLRRIPLVLFSATFSRPLGKAFYPARVFNRWRFQSLRFVACVSETDVLHFRSLFTSAATTPPAAALGDTRYDQVLHRLQESKELPFRSLSDSRFTGVLGSTWFEDDQVWIDALTETDLRQNYRWIWVPHEVSLRKIQDLADQLKTSGFKVEKLSEIETWRSDILIIDRVGLLAELYKRADLAFVGGSFVGKVHSVMEPLAAGCPVVVGPYFENNREATEFQQVELADGVLTAVTCAPTAEDLKAWLRDLLPLLGQPQLKESIQEAIRDRSQVTQKLVAELIQRKIFEPIPSSAVKASQSDNAGR